LKTKYATINANNTNGVIRGAASEYEVPIVKVNKRDP
jgi:hypothetical protein